MVGFAIAVMVALLIGAVAGTAWAIAKAKRAGTGILLAAIAGFTVLWVVGLVNFFALATQ